MNITNSLLLGLELEPPSETQQQQQQAQGTSVKQPSRSEESAQSEQIAERRRMSNRLRPKLKRDSSLATRSLHDTYAHLWRSHQCAQIWYRRNRNYRSTSCSCEASRERRRRALPLFLPRRSYTRERLAHFFLFSSLSPCNAIFRFDDFGFRVEIENCISLDSVQKRREADENFKFTKYAI